MHTLRLPAAIAATAMLLVLNSACSDSGASTASSTNTTTGTSNETGLRTAKWGSNVTITFENGSMRYVSNGLPNHSRQAQYALPNAGVRVPSSTTAYAGTDPSAAQSYNYLIPLTPTKAASPTSTSLGTIGVMISGAALFNPYEGDGSTVALANNFTVKNANGQDVAFLDACNGHPTPMGMYHYHALPPCVTATVDVAGGPSHLIGIAFDGFPIYGDRDMTGKQLTAADLDQCNGVTSATPEFPNGVYHYVLLTAANSTSSIRCLSGKLTVVSSQVQSSHMSMTGM
jgi:hypothetical protein